MRVFQIVLSDIPDPIRICMETVEDIYPHVEVLKRESKLTGLELIKESDNWRVEILSSCDDILFIDWDIELYSEFESTIKYKANEYGVMIPINKHLLSCNYFKGIPDYSVIYSPKKEIWEEVERVRKQYNYEKSTFAWLRKTLRHMKINKIQGNYKHLRYSSNKKYAL